MPTNRSITLTIVLCVMSLLVSCFGLLSRSNQGVALRWYDFALPVFFVVMLVDLFRSHRRNKTPTS
jgi:uncharacterized membrane protein